MKLTDIHSHILPDIDDGAENLEEALAILSMMKAQGISVVFATPHFYAHEQNLDDYFSKARAAEEKLRDAMRGSDLPEIIMGCEVLYFKRIGNSRDIKRLTLGGSQYILLELANSSINDIVISDIKNIIEQQGLIPIIAHIERYAGERGFEKLLKLVKSGEVLSQVNAGSLLSRSEQRVVKKLMKRQLVTFIATDSHSSKKRPPMMLEAIEQISKLFGEEYAESLIENSHRLLRQIHRSGGGV